MASAPAIERTSHTVNTAITAVTATIVALAVLAADRHLRRHATSEVQAQTLLRAIEEHRGDIQRGARHMRAMPEPDQHHPRRTG